MSMCGCTTGFKSILMEINCFRSGHVFQFNLLYIEMSVFVKFHGAFLYIFRKHYVLRTYFMHIRIRKYVCDKKDILYPCGVL